MASIDQYESLKSDGTWQDRLTYVVSLSDKNEIENHLKKSASTSYDDLQMLIFLSWLTKNDKNLLEIFKSPSFPTRQRAIACQRWLLLQKDKKQILEFLITFINDKTIPRYLKQKMVKKLCHIDVLRKSPSFFYDTACHLIDSNNYSRYNFAAYLLPFCKTDQIIDLLSRWSIKGFEQIDRSTTLRSRLIDLQPSIAIQLMKADLDALKVHSTKFADYFQRNGILMNSLSKKVPKEVVCLAVEYLNQLQPSIRSIPALIVSHLTYFFKKAPNEMIQLITTIASIQPGILRESDSWRYSSQETNSLSLPRSFSIESHVRLFLALYNICKWSSNNTVQIFRLMLKSEKEKISISRLQKERKWLIDNIIEKHIGKELFLKKLLEEGRRADLDLFEKYPEITTPLSIHLLAQHESNNIVTDSTRLEFIRYQSMTQNLYDKFLLLMKNTGSDVFQRRKNYVLLFQCALLTNQQFVKTVLQFIAKRFANEQLIVIEYLLNYLTSAQAKLHFQILPDNLESIETIINIAMNHLQESYRIRSAIPTYGSNLLQCVEYYRNQEAKKIIQEFAWKIIKKYCSGDVFTFDVRDIPESYTETWRQIADFLISDIYPALISESKFSTLNNSLDMFKTKVSYLPQIDSFINSFFTKTLLESEKIQSELQIGNLTTMIDLFLKNRSTRFERVNHLINKIDKVFFVYENVQRIVVCSQQHRQLIDTLLQDDKCLTLEKLLKESNKFLKSIVHEIRYYKVPGLDTDILNSSLHRLTGKQQEHITNIILNDYLVDADVPKLSKLKLLRIFCRLTRTYNKTLEWFHAKFYSSSTVEEIDENPGPRTRYFDPKTFDKVIVCLPATFDLDEESLLKQFHLLKTKLNTSNAMFVADTMLSISRRINEELFLKSYLELLRDEQLPKLGITAYKEVLRLLILYSSDPTLVETDIKPLWDSHPHQDLRACLILILLHFVGKHNSDDIDKAIWQILEQAAEDDYLIIVQSLFAFHQENSRRRLPRSQRGTSCWPLTRWKNLSDPLYEEFVNRIQLKVLDHPTSLNARSWAWENIEYEHCDKNELFGKAQKLCIQFDETGNKLWAQAFNKIILLYRENKISSIYKLIDFIKKVASLREDIDLQENAINFRHDLPAYRRLETILGVLINSLENFNNEKQLALRALAPIIIQLDKTLASYAGEILIKTAQNKEDMENGIKFLQQNLPENFFENLLMDLSHLLRYESTDYFISKMNIDEKLAFAEWFINEKNRPLFVHNFLTEYVFNHKDVNRQQCQQIIRSWRQSENLCLKQKAMSYCVPWDKNTPIDDKDNDSLMFD
ncbi:unnamed protein product [Rotaria sp. Silwood2]|nr:unnamed protein product [Rotaria sp. Silwood2]CAF3059199.1 unnamed protein product [Rotaria sp. Silwood2]CAF3388680.1 unnamed protein product [Rotaria sp. Silwood2]CAF4080266.1 unnamed protein product [Rotaria sp. Silwood2]CAF4275178.1 unnamed protein product [Rotaria sp. Silwood2]